MAKSREAFRTISEVAEWLDTPAHVLRFWESKFTQVKPIKRAGGRRYYRPSDMSLLAGIKKLLHDDGMTIKGVQKILREQGVKHVSSLSALTVDEDQDALDHIPDTPEAPFAGAVTPPRDTDDSTVIAFARPAEQAQDASSDTDLPTQDQPDHPDVVEPLAGENVIAPDAAGASEDGAPEDTSPAGEAMPTDAPSAAFETEQDPDDPASGDRDDPTGSTVPEPPQPDLVTPDPAAGDKATAEMAGSLPANPPGAAADAETGAQAEPASSDGPEQPGAGQPDTPPDEAASDTQPARPAPSVPLFSRRMPDPPQPAGDDWPRALTAVSRLKRLGPAQARDLAPLMERLAAQADRLSGKTATTEDKKI